MGNIPRVPGNIDRVPGAGYKTIANQNNEYHSRKDTFYETRTQRMTEHYLPVREHLNYGNQYKNKQIPPAYRDYAPQRDSIRLTDRVMKDYITRSYDYGKVGQGHFLREQQYSQGKFHKSPDDINFLNRRTNIAPLGGHQESVQRRRDMPERQIGDYYPPAQRKVVDYIYRPTEPLTQKRMVSQDYILRGQPYLQDRFRKPEDVNLLGRRSDTAPLGGQQIPIQRRYEVPVRQMDERYYPTQRKVYESFPRTDQKDILPDRFQRRGYQKATVIEPPKYWHLQSTIPGEQKLQTYPRHFVQTPLYRQPFQGFPSRSDQVEPPTRIDTSRLMQLITTRRLGAFVKPRFTRPDKFEVVTKMSIHTNFSAEMYRGLVDTVGPGTRASRKWFIRSTISPDVEETDEKINKTTEEITKNITHYSVPIPTVKVIWKLGTKLAFTVSIPDTGRIAECHFHGSTVKPGKYTLFLPGLWNRVIKEPENGCFTYKATNTRLKVGDTVYFWLMVILTNGELYVRDRLNFTILYSKGVKYAAMFWNGTFSL